MSLLDIFIHASIEFVVLVHREIFQVVIGLETSFRPNTPHVKQVRKRTGRPDL